MIGGLAASKALTWACVALLAVLLIANALWSLAYSRAIADRNAARAERDAQRADVATQRAQFEAQARQKEREQSQALAGVAAIYEQEMNDAQAEHDAVVADLLSGAARLRRHWQGCAATAELSATVATAARADAGAGLRAASAGRIVRAGDECDAHIRGLQAALRTYAGETR